MKTGSIFKVVGLTKVHEYWGDDPNDFLVELHCEVTKKDAPGGEAFKVIVASPSQLQRELEHRDKVELGRGYLFMLDYNEKEVVACLQRILDGSPGSSWTELSSHVTKYFEWID